MSPKRNPIAAPRPWGRDNEGDAWRDTLPHDTYAEWDQRPDGTYGFRPKSALSPPGGFSAATATTAPSAALTSTRRHI